MSNGEVLVVPKDGLLEAARGLVGRGFDSLHCITAVDNKDHIELIYSFYSLKKHAGVILKTRLAGDLSVESLEKYWKSADWLEREIFDLFGVTFLNHPNLKRILNPDEWTIHPLRKT
jgi:NADH-quinone oxidoreductase subunit C